MTLAGRLAAYLPPEGNPRRLDLLVGVVVACYSAFCYLAAHPVRVASGQRGRSAWDVLTTAAFLGLIAAGACGIRRRLARHLDWWAFRHRHRTRRGER